MSTTTPPRLSIPSRRHYGPWLIGIVGILLSILTGWHLFVVAQWVRPTVERIHEHQLTDQGVISATLNPFSNRIELIIPESFKNRATVRQTVESALQHQSDSRQDLYAALIPYRVELHFPDEALSAHIPSLPDAQNVPPIQRRKMPPPPGSQQPAPPPTETPEQKQDRYLGVLRNHAILDGVTVGPDWQSPGTTIFVGSLRNAWHSPLTKAVARLHYVNRDKGEEWTHDFTLLPSEHYKDAVLKHGDHFDFRYLLPSLHIAPGTVKVELVQIEFVEMPQLDPSPATTQP